MSFVGRNNRKLTNRENGGGNKKQGIPSTTDYSSASIRHIKLRALGQNRDLVFCINQLGGIGRYKSQFKPPGVDGVQCKKGEFNPINNKILDCLKDIELFVKKLIHYLKKEGERGEGDGRFLFKLCLIGIHESFQNDIAQCHHVSSSIKDMSLLLPYSDLASAIYSVYTTSSGKSPNFSLLNGLLKEFPYDLPKTSEGGRLLDSVRYLNHNIPTWVNKIQPSLGDHKVSLIYNGLINNSQTAHDILYQCGYGVRVPSFDHIWAYAKDKKIQNKGEKIKKVSEKK